MASDTTTQIPRPALRRLLALTRQASATGRYETVLTYRQALRDCFGMAGDEIDAELRTFAVTV